MRLRGDLGRGPAPRAQVRRQSIEALLIDVEVQEADPGRRPHAQHVGLLVREGKLYIIDVAVLQRLVADVEVAVLGGFVYLITAPVDTSLPGLVAFYDGVDV